MAWRVALRASGTPFGAVDGTARYGVGCGVNAIAPLHAGSAVRVALFARRTSGGEWTVGGAAAAVGAIRGTWLVALVAAGSAMGALPAWPLLMFAGGGIGFVAAVGAWSLAGATAKLGAAAAVAGAFGIGRPLGAALVIVGAVELAAIMPLTPGNVGIASAAVALALSARGIDSDIGLAVGIAFGAVEWLTGLGLGVASCLVLTRGRFDRRLVVFASAAGAWALAVAFGATVVLPAF